ncbi:hypothetical protein ABLT09_06260, partial [Pseudomonas aeruginosa]
MTKREAGAGAKNSLASKHQAHEKAPPKRGFCSSRWTSVLAIAAQAQGLAGDAGVLELGQQAL